MKLVNLTPHPITIIGDTTFTLPVAGPAPRLDVARKQLEPIASDHGPIAIVRSTLGDPSGLPHAVDDTIYIVSALVAEHPSLSSRSDLAYPGEAVRDEAGKIIGCRGLCAGPGLANPPAHEIIVSDGLLNGGRYPVFFLIGPDGSGRKFAFSSIPGICAVRTGAYEKNGKWSNMTYYIRLAPGVRLVNATAPLHGLPYGNSGSWDECAKFLGVTVQQAKAILSPTSDSRKRFDEYERSAATIPG